MPRGNEPRFDDGDLAGDLGDFHFVGHWLSFLGEPQQEEEMQIGFNLPISGPLSSPDIVTRIAQEGEALGYDYLTLTDHIVLPNLRVPGYPYSESGEFFSEGPERRHEQLTTAAYIAAKTSRIRLVLAVMVVPHRPAVLAAKMLATIDVLSGGRLVVGIGDAL
jgi:alkanesulfonate monooxygenase SsuD/methylene tetrahydromethanopterin reductase-like flavin-dependent oxidoreductase (luciferase family)